MVHRNTVLIIWYSIAILYHMVILQYCMVHNLLSLLILTILSACGGFLSSRKSVAPAERYNLFFKTPPSDPPKNATAAQPLLACNLLIKIKNKNQNKFIVSEKLYIRITDTINGFRSTLACCEVLKHYNQYLRSCIHF